MAPGGSGSRQDGWTILEVGIVLALVGLLLALALPNFHAARIRNDEAAAVRTLREIAKAQAMVRRAALVDEDSDALLSELSGERNPRAHAGAGGARPAALPQFALRVGPEGEGEICGYRFRVYLPGPLGVAVAESAGDPSGPVDPRLAGEVWCAYAWPVRYAGFVPAATGRRTFFANQSGEILCADAAYTAVPEKDGEDPRPPKPGAAFAAPGPLDTITGPPAAGTTGRDGLVWMRVL